MTTEIRCLAILSYAAVWTTLEWVFDAAASIAPGLRRLRKATPPEDWRYAINCSVACVAYAGILYCTVMTLVLGRFDRSPERLFIDPADPADPNHVAHGMSVRLAEVSIGYALYDFFVLSRGHGHRVWQVFTRSTDMALHHTWLIAGTYTGVQGGYLVYYITLSYLTEISSVPLSLMLMFKRLGMANTVACKASGAALWLTYLLVRVPVMPYVVHGIALDFWAAGGSFGHPAPGISAGLHTFCWMQLACGTAMAVLNVVWFVKITKGFVKVLRLRAPSTEE